MRKLTWKKWRTITNLIIYTNQKSKIISDEAAWNKINTDRRSIFVKDVWYKIIRIDVLTNINKKKDIEIVNQKVVWKTGTDLLWINFLLPLKKKSKLIHRVFRSMAVRGPTRWLFQKNHTSFNLIYWFCFDIISFHFSLSRYTQYICFISIPP